MADASDNISVADILGPWIEPDFDSGLIARCREAWSKPLRNLSREELATLLRQRFAVDHLLPIAKKKLEERDDGTEMFDGELQEAIEHADRAVITSAKAKNRQSGLQSPRLIEDSSDLFEI